MARTRVHECAHGVDTGEFCEDCAHHPEEEWVGYPMLICPAHSGGAPWPCDFEKARRVRAARGQPHEETK